MATNLTSKGQVITVPKRVRDYLGLFTAGPLTARTRFLKAAV
jgi:bifunctional DNA-binding transcriptional regulator/antitoxin component of YhaV-PrlF toxin-antitoxin module